jgi:hypothetical protein
VNDRLTSPAASDTLRPMRARLYTSLFVASALAVVACGARSDLDVGVPEPLPDAGPDVVDAPPDVPADVPVDVPADVPVDVPPDVPPDVVDAPFDAPPPICDDAGVTYIYVITESGSLYSYYPPSNAFTFIAPVGCPSLSPYSMAVDRGGTAYVVSSPDGHLFEVSTADGTCKETSFVPDQDGFLTFGMGFSADMNDPGETLFVAEADFNGPSQGLASIDTTTFAFSFIGPFSPSIGRSELTGTGDGRLFAFSLDASGPGSVLSQIDKTTAQVLSSVPLAVGDTDDGFAYAFWGGSFYIFTSPGGASTVTQYNPADQSLQNINTLSDVIVGAGVSTCAPH